ncbi:MAG: leucyl aminopeptidase [Acidobacteriota bacterium]
MPRYVIQSRGHFPEVVVHVEIRKDPNFAEIDNLFVLVAEGGDGPFPIEDALRDEISRLRARSGFTGRKDESVTLVTETGPRKVTLVGLGEASSVNVRVLKAALRAMARSAQKNRDARIAVLFPYQLPLLDDAATTRAVADFLIHSDYAYEPYITVREDRPREDISCVLIPPRSVSGEAADRLLEEAVTIAAAVRVARDLGNGPGNLVTPTRMADRAAEVARNAGLKCTVYDKKEIQKQNMGGLLAVNSGSNEEPRFVVMEYTPRSARKTVCLVGKGITFDSGGISIKPAEKMEEMKFDMCGAAAVIGIMQAAATLELPVKLVGIFASTENLSGGSAYKPGDIVTTMSGKTIEIVNTDAEGRVILSDALHYAKRFKPDHLIDFATLTGACVVALGAEASGLFSNDSELARKLIEAGEKTGERLWRLPEWSEYKDLIRSEWADMKNSGGRWGGAVTAALFLKEFVDCPSWAHMDIAGTAWTEGETPRDPKGATGVGIRTTIEFLRSLDT